MDRWMTGSMDLWIDMSCEMSGGLLVTAHGGLGHRGTVPARDETTGFITIEVSSSCHIMSTRPFHLACFRAEQAGHDCRSS